MEDSADADPIRTYRFEHHAMATAFEVYLPDDSEGSAHALATALFSEIDLLEAELSRFREGSDIFRINRLRRGESTRVSLATFDCLSLAKDVCAATGGAFDVTVGPLMKAWMNPDGTIRQPGEADLRAARERVGSQHFELDPDSISVRALADGLHLDLGALGKGYALDQLAALLEARDLPDALLNAGDSTILGLGKPPGKDAWRITAGQRSVALSGQALSGSGFEVRGSHIMDPRTGTPAPVNRRRIIWALAPTAALADALSTAFMLMEDAEIADFCAGQEGVEAIFDTPPLAVED